MSNRRSTLLPRFCYSGREAGKPSSSVGRMSPAKAEKLKILERAIRLEKQARRAEAITYANTLFACITQADLLKALSDSLGKAGSVQRVEIAMLLICISPSQHRRAKRVLYSSLEAPEQHVRIAAIRVFGILWWIGRDNIAQLQRVGSFDTVGEVREFAKATVSKITGLVRNGGQQTEDS